MNTFRVIITVLSFSLMTTIALDVKAQEIGYITGFNKIGLSPETFQPLYGFTLGMHVNKYFAFETALFYNQRQVKRTTQADYFTFALTPKVGYFGKRAGIFLGAAINLNPCLYHSNIENHTYLSTTPLFGGELYLGPKIIVDLKAGYDIGFTNSYFLDNTWSKYKGKVIFAGIKYRIK